MTSSAVAVLLHFWRAQHARPIPFVPDPAAPIVTTTEYANRFREFNALGLTLQEAQTAARAELGGSRSSFPGYSFGFSTGTSGYPGVFITSRAERLRWMGTILARYTSLRQLPGLRIALILKHNNLLYSHVSLQYFDPTEPVEQWAEKVCSMEPNVLIGPVSQLEALALSSAFSKHPFRVRLLVAAGEPMFPQDGRLLEFAFGVRPRPIYQAREGFLAFGCILGKLHWNQDLIGVESLPFAGRAIPVITSLTRRTQRYVRYQMDDVFSGRRVTCACESPMDAFDHVEGRLQDVLVKRSGSGVSPLFPFDLNHVLGEPRRFCLLQPGLDEFLLAGDGDLERLRELVCPATVQRIEDISTQPGEKRRRFQRLFTMDWTTWRNDSAGR